MIDCSRPGQKYLVHKEVGDAKLTESGPYFYLTRLILDV